MDKRRIKAVIFDLGETLLNFGRLDRNALFEEAAVRSYEHLKKLNQPVGSLWSYRLTHIWGVRWNLLKSWITGNDFDSLELLKSYGKSRGFALDESQWEELNWQWYDGLSKLAHIEPGTADMLKTLRSMGLKVALLSNTFVHKSTLERHLQAEGLLEFFDMTMYSYDFNYRKPDARIFKVAAERLNIDPHEAIYVGDRMDNDVTGATAAGMLPVLKKAYTNKNVRVPADTARIAAITELPDWIRTHCDTPAANDETNNHQPVYNGS